MKYFLFLSVNRGNAIAAELCDTFSKTGVQSTLKASDRKENPHKHAPKIRVTIHSGLATVSLKVIINGNQNFNPSAVPRCWDYLQVLNVIQSLCFSEKSCYMG